MISLTALTWGLAAALAVGCAGALSGAARGRRGLPGERLARTAGPLAMLAVLARGLGRPVPPADLSRRLLQARAPAWLGPGEAMALKIAAAGAAALAGLLVAPSLPGRLGVVTLAAGPALGFVALDLVLVRRARRRSRMARLEAPELLDRVRMVADAGLSPAEALARAARGGTGPLSAELRAMAVAAHMGEGRAAGLERLRDALPVPEAHALAAAVLRCERHGTPLGPEVAAIAAGARAERTRLLRDRAERSAPKIQLVVALLLVPAVLLLVAAGLLAGLR